jgi:hypothetical protein
MLARKKITRELGKAPIPEVLKTIIQEEISAGEAYFMDVKPISTDHKARANSFFKKTVEEFDGCFV